MRSRTPFSGTVQQRGGSFFGRRKGKALRPGQRRALETILPALRLDLSTPAPDDLAALFPLPAAAINLEIGFGGGEHLLDAARAHPGAGFIGVEPFENGMAKAVAAIARDAIRNVRLFDADAALLLDWLPAASLARVDLLYPDPWPKRRHWKRRFVQDRSVAEIARVLRPGGEFRFASDIPDYAAWTLAHVLRSSAFEWTAERADDWRQPWPGFFRTRYEAKAEREGRAPCYLIFKRIANSE